MGTPDMMIAVPSKEDDGFTLVTSKWRYSTPVLKVIPFTVPHEKKHRNYVSLLSDDDDEKIEISPILVNVQGRAGNSISSTVERSTKNVSVSKVDDDDNNVGVRGTWKKLLHKPSTMPKCDAFADVAAAEHKSKTVSDIQIPFQSMTPSAENHPADVHENFGVIQSYVTAALNQVAIATSNLNGMRKTGPIESKDDHNHDTSSFIDNSSVQTEKPRRTAVNVVHGIHPSSKAFSLFPRLWVAFMVVAKLLSGVPRVASQGITCSNPFTGILDNSNIHYAAYNWLAYPGNRGTLLYCLGDIQNWDTSRVTNMDHVFGYATPAFIDNIGAPLDWNQYFSYNLQWDTSKVTSMDGMLYNARNFNGDVSRWDTSKVTSMLSMFNYASNFNGDVSRWITSQVTNMYLMFQDASNFNGNVSRWDTSRVTSMQGMFRIFSASASKFNCDVSRWDTSRVISMQGMFSSASKFNGDVSRWDTSKVTTMDGMFLAASNFNGDVSRWNISKVTTLSWMFSYAKSFNGDLSRWITSQVRTMDYTFNMGAGYSYVPSVFNGDLSLWDTSRVTSMYRTFYNASSFNQVICWDTSKVTSLAQTVVGSYGSFATTPYPYCRGFSMFTNDHFTKLVPHINTTYPVAYNYPLTALPMIGQQRVTFQLNDPSTDFTLDSQVTISFDFLISNRVGYRHSICFLENESDLDQFCQGNTTCLSCFDLTGTRVGSPVSISPAPGSVTNFQLKPLDFSDKQLLDGKKIAYVAFINDSDGNSPSPTSTFINLTWMRYLPLKITSPSSTSIKVQLADSSAAAIVASFKLSLNKVISPYSKTLVMTLTSSRDVLASATAGVTIVGLESGSRYSILLQPTSVPSNAASMLDFFGYGIVKCTCPSSVSSSTTDDQTGMPLAASVVQRNGFVSMVFTDNSVCEEAYAFTRQQGNNAQSVFAPNYYFYSTKECGNELNPGMNFADDLSLSHLDIGATYRYCTEAIAMNYMASNVSIVSPNRVSSDAACQYVTISWEASIKGLVTSKADTGSIPIDMVTVTWTLMDPKNMTVPLNCTNTVSICSGNYITDSSGSFQAHFFVQEPDLGLNRTDPIPVWLTFSRSFDGNHSDTFLANDEQTDITANGTIVYLKHLQFDKPLFAVDASTVTFSGSVFVRNTPYLGFYGCPVVNVEVCAYEVKTASGGSTKQQKLACHNSASDGTFKLPLPIGAIVHNVTLTYFSHEFVPAPSNDFAALYKQGILIDPMKQYFGNDFVDMTIAPVQVDVVGGLCNKTMGTAFIQYSILGCSWTGATLHQENHIAIQYVPAHVIQFYGVTVKDSAHRSISVLEDFFADKQKTVDLRKWVDALGAVVNADSDSSLSQSGTTSQTANYEYVRFQYDGQLKLIFNVTSEERIGNKCKQECRNATSIYCPKCDSNQYCETSFHVIDNFSILTFDVPVFFEILPGLTCDIVEEGTKVTLQNHLGYENIPNFEGSDFFQTLDSTEKEMIRTCYPSCVNNITYTNGDAQSRSGAGLHNFSLFAGRVEITSPYTRTILIKVSGYTSSAQFQEFEHQAYFVIQGYYKDGNGLSFALPTHTPAMILRDPPGGKSFANYENVQTTLKVDSKESADNLDYEVAAGLTVKTGAKMTTCFGLGVAVCTPSEVKFALQAFDISNKLGGRVKYWKTDDKRSRSITWTYQTSTDPWIAGEMSDIFVVPNLNVMYQQVRVVLWNRYSCKVFEICDTLGCPRLPMDIVFDLHDKKTQEALAFYSRYHIEYVKLPDLNIALGIKQQKQLDILANKPVCGELLNSPCSATDKNNTEVEIATLRNGIDGWNVALDQERNITQQLGSTVKDWGCMNSSGFSDGICLTTPLIPSKISSNAVLLTNVPPGFNPNDMPLENINRIQFSGGGNTMSMKLSLETDMETTQDKPMTNVANEFTFESGAVKIEVEVAGNGMEGVIKPFKLSQKHEFKNELTDGSGYSTSISFELGDDDPQDEFVVDLYVDYTFGGIIFKTVGGRSKCPYEKGTAAVEIPMLEVVSSPSSKVSADDDLLFYVEAANKGVGISLFVFYTQLLRDNDGLEISIDGVNLGLELQFFSVGSYNNLLPEKYRKLVRIKRGPNKFINRSFLLSWESSCEDANSPVADLTTSSFPDSTASSTVELYNFEDAVTGARYLQWIEKCPRIEWASSIKFNNGFLVTTQDDMNSLSISIFNAGYGSTALKTHNRLQIPPSTGVFLLYRMVGTQRWIRGQMIVNGTTMDANFVSNDIVEDSFGYIQLNWVISENFVQDGTYEITVKVICDNVWGSPDELILPSVIGVIDRSYPQRYDLPHPIENEVHVGQEISLAFTKSLFCSPIPFNIQIVVGNLTLKNSELLIHCHENIIGFVIDFTKVPITQLVGKTFTVEIGHIYTSAAAIKDINGNPTDPSKGNIRFEKTFLPLGQDTQTSFVLSLNSVVSQSMSQRAVPINSVCYICANYISSGNCTTLEMRQYQEALIRKQLSSMMTLDVTDRVSVASIDCTSNTVTGTVTFTDPPKPTLPPTAVPTFIPTSSMKPIRKPTKRPSNRPTSTLTRKPTVTSSFEPTVNPTLKPLGPTAEPSLRPTSNPTSSPTRVQLRSSKGLIYNKGDGLCLAFVGAVVLMIPCDDRNATSQSWVSMKKSSDVFYLKSNSSKCLDSGDLSEGSSIFLNDCNNDTTSQIWTYDESRHLQPDSARHLCATIFNEAVALTTVKLSSCSYNSPYNYSQVWGEFSLYGGSGGSKLSYFICPEGEKVMNITGRAGAWINEITMTCDRGTKLGSAGNSSGGYLVSATCLEGYTGVSVISGSYVGKLSATCARASGSISFGSAIGSYGSGSVDQTQCKGNEKIIGFYSRHGNYVDSVNIICGPVQTNPTARPTTKPTTRPTTKPTARPTKKPTARPTKKPTARPTVLPSATPTAIPTAKPTAIPTAQPTAPFIVNSNIHLAAYLWVTNNTAALAEYGDIQIWDVSRVTNMTHLFGRYNPYNNDPDWQNIWSSSFNDDLSAWNTSRVQSMQGMFCLAASFNGNLSQWDTSKVTDMTDMFISAVVFNGDLSPWNTSQVTDLTNAFYDAKAFNGDLSKWDISQVSSLDSMFYYATSFNGDLSLWNTSQVRSMDNVFAEDHAFNGDLSRWDTAQVTSMNTMFYNAPFNGDLSKWDTSQVLSMANMFWGSYFNGDLSLWNTSQVKGMQYMFYYASGFRGGLEQWDTSSVRYMQAMFYGASSFNGNLSLWNTSQVQTMTNMFTDAISFNGNLSLWDTRNVISMEYMFQYASSFNGDLSFWNTSQVQTMTRMFYNAASFNQVLCWDVSKVISSDYMFDGSLGSLSVSPYPGCLTVKPTARPTATPTVRPTKKPTARPSKKITKKPSAKPSRKPSARPTKKPSAKPSLKRTRKPSAKPSRIPSKRPSRKPTRTPSKRPSRKPTRTPSKRPTKSPFARRIKVVDNMENLSSTDLLVDLMQNMVVLDSAHHGRHLRFTNARYYSDVYSQVRNVQISHIVISSRESPEATSPYNKWELLGTNSSAHRFSSFRNLLNSELTMSGENLDHVKDEIGRRISSVKDEVSSVKDDVKSEMTKMNDVVSSVKDDVKTEMTKMKNDVSFIINDQVKKKIKPLEEKLDRISQLLERVLAM